MSKYIGTALRIMGYQADIDFVCQDDSDGRGPYLKEWLSDKPRPTDESIDEMVAALENGTIRYTPPKTPEERITELEAIVAQLTEGKS